MSPVQSSQRFRRMDAFEQRLCLPFNRAAERRAIQSFFAAVSRLGDGVLWYTLMAILPLVDGWDGAHASLHMAIVALLGLAIYKWMKGHLLRSRPYVTHAAIRVHTAPLDVCSFPSGHTLHAVAFTLVSTAYYPQLAWVTVPFTVLVALSRVVLGLHYPSDVAIGALIGASLALGSLHLL